MFADLSLAFGVVAEEIAHTKTASSQHDSDFAYADRYFEHMLTCTRLAITHHTYDVSHLARAWQRYTLTLEQRITTNSTKALPHFVAIIQQSLSELSQPLLM